MTSVLLAMLLEQRFHLGDLLPQVIDLAQRVFVVVGDFGDERHHFGPIEAAERGSETKLAQIERADFHRVVSS